MGIGPFVRVPAGKEAFKSTRSGKPVRGDMILLAVSAILVIFGIVMIDSASPHYCQVVLKADPMCMVTKQLIWIPVAIAGAFFMSRIDYRTWKKLAVPMIILVILGLLGVLIANQLSSEPVRAFFNGSIRPAEVAKVGIVIYLAVWLFAKRESLHDYQLGLLPLAGILGLVGGLVFLQDISAGVTIIMLGIVLFFLAGGDIRQFVIFILITLLAGVLVVVISQKASERMEPYLAGLKNPFDSDYQVLRSLEALVRGSWLGLGLGRSVTKVTGLPVAPLDSIFAVLVEELGLVGGILLIGLYGIFLWRGMRIAQNAPDMLGAVMAGGLTIWVISEAVVSMGSIVGLLPVAGNSLPFISYGGSSLVTTFAAVGLLFNISRQTGTSTREAGERRVFSATTDMRRRDRRRRLPRTSRP